MHVSLLLNASGLYAMIFLCDIHESIPENTYNFRNNFVINYSLVLLGLYSRDNCEYNTVYLTKIENFTNNLTYRGKCHGSLRVTKVILFSARIVFHAEYVTSLQLFAILNAIFKFH